VTSLEDLIRNAVDAGAQEITVRVSRENADGEPEAYQALVKYRDMTKAFDVGIRANPMPALRAALSRFEPTKGVFE
jgi:signal transduction histidine kinase